MRSKKNIYIRLVMLLMAFTLVSNAWGQTTTTDLYQTVYGGNSIENEYIKSKKQTKWHDLRKELQSTTIKDKFDENTTSFPVNWNDQKQIQAAHELIDTIYVHEGSTFDITLPDFLQTGENPTSSIRSYQRWYNFRTGKIFKLKDPLTKDKTITDLLIPFIR